MPGWLRRIGRVRWLIDWFRPENIGEVDEDDVPPPPPPPPVLRFEARDGMIALDVYRAPNGLYRFEEWTETHDE